MVKAAGLPSGLMEFGPTLIRFLPVPESEIDLPDKFIFVGISTKYVSELFMCF